MTENNYELDILINGKSVKEYIKGDGISADSQLYIEGREGTDFSLRIRNNSSKRILAIPSVDGLSVMNGKEASYDSSGYIINSHDSLTIDGWRMSNSEVAKFYFSKQGESYAAKMDKDGNIGVIGLVIFDEKFDEIAALKEAMKELEKYPKIVEKHIHHDRCWNRYCLQCQTYHCVYSPCLPNHSWTYVNSNSGLDTGGSNINLSQSNMNVTPTETIRSVNPLKQELGTGWGESKRSEVRTVEFERKDSPEAIFEIFYNTRKQLTEMGIDLNAKPVYVAPQAFPNQYCKPPVK